MVIVSVRRFIVNAFLSSAAEFTPAVDVKLEKPGWKLRRENGRKGPRASTNSVVRDSRFIEEYIAIIYINTVDAVTINSCAHSEQNGILSFSLNKLATIEAAISAA